MQIIAHRGASGEFPENSLLAFEQAIAQQADAIEFDVQFHQASQTYIVLHDHYLDKTTNSQGHFNSKTLEELIALDIGQQQKLVTLEAALKFIAGRIAVNIELKSTSLEQEELEQETSALNTLLIKAIHQFGFTKEQIVLSSFNHPFIRACKTYLPDIARSALIAHIPCDLTLPFANKGYLSINIAIDCLNEKLVEDALKRNLKVWVYTVDQPEEVIKCLQLGVSAIFTNYPKRSKEIVTKLLYL